MDRFNNFNNNKNTLEDLLTDSKINSLIEKYLDGEVEEILSEEDPIPHPLNRDGEVQFHIGSNKMMVTADFYPHQGTGKLLTEDYVLKMLRKIGVSPKVVDLEKISSVLQKCNNIGIPINNVTVAKGKYSKPKIPTHVELILNPKKYIQAARHLSLIKRLECIDFKNISQFCIIEKGTPVAIRLEEQQGSSGIDVLGNEIAFQTSEIEQIKIGKNLQILDDGEIITKIDGEFVYNRDEIFVNKVLVLANGVNYHTGHINFPGTVIINGEVEDGFNIRAKENIHVLNSLAATKISCGGCLSVVSGGIIGRKENKIDVCGNVTAIHTESVNMEVEKGIFLEKGALHSNLFSNGEVIFGPIGILLGGKTYSKDGIHIYSIGNETAVHTFISCGVDFRNIQDILNLKVHKEKLLEAESYYIYRRMGSIVSEIKSQILKINLSLERIIREMQYNESAKIVISGTIYPGSVIEICFCKYIVKKKISNITFFLDKQQGEVIYKTNYLSSHDK